MFRKAIPLLLGAFLLPQPGSGQVPDTLAPPAGATGQLEVGVSTESQVFLGALRSILDHHQTTFSDSTLWEEALDGLLEGLNDPYAAIFTAEEL